MLIAKNYIDYLLKTQPNGKYVIFRYPDIKTKNTLPVEEFLKLYGNMNVDFNGDFVDELKLPINAYIFNRLKE